MTSQQNIQTIRGYITALPRQGGKDEAALVAVHDDNGTDYYIVPKGMGLDLSEHINVGVEVTGIVQQKEEIYYLQVRSYDLKDEYADEWYDDSDK